MGSGRGVRTWREGRLGRRATTAPPRGGRNHGATAPAKVHRASVWPPGLRVPPAGRRFIVVRMATRPERFRLLGFVVGGPVNPAGGPKSYTGVLPYCRMDRAESRRRLPPGVPLGCARLHWQGLSCRIGIRTGSPFRRWSSGFRIVGIS